MKFIGVLALVLAGIAPLAAAVRLCLKDGTYQSAREYKVESDRVRFYSTDREEWEEIPLNLVDLKRTEAEVNSREQRVQQEAREDAAEEKAERQMAHEAALIPGEPGVYRIIAGKVVSVKQAESKVVNNKRRNILKAMSPIPLITGKSTLELDGPHSATIVTDTLPEFYIRLSEDERFGFVRLNDHKGNRIVEKITTVPVSNEVVEEPDTVSIFRKQVGDGSYKIWPEKPLAPGEYAVVEYTEGKLNMQVWDFAVAPGAK